MSRSSRTPRLTAPWVTAATAAAAAAVGTGVMAVHRAGRLPGGSARWARRNHRGDEVTLVEGVAVSTGLVLPLALVDPPAAVAALGTTLAGALDDLTGDTGTKGLRGHLRAARAGRLTTGLVKILVLVQVGACAAAWSDHRQPRGVRISTLAAAGLVAGGANLVNLLDLRPGRALKVVLAGGIPLGLTGSGAGAALVGAGAAALPADLAGRSMLGDTGANPLGAVLGLAAAQRLGDGGRWATLAAVTALTLVSERVSFTRVIESTPVLDALDRWGRPR